METAVRLLQEREGFQEGLLDVISAGFPAFRFQHNHHHHRLFFVVVPICSAYGGQYATLAKQMLKQAGFV
jgi:hypothetical protein